MARTRTLLEMETRVRELSDCMPLTNPRHSSTFIRTCINESWAALRSMVTAHGDLTYVKPVDVSTGVGPDTGAAYGLLAMPVTAVSIVAIDLTHTSGRAPRSLLPASFNDRNAFAECESITGQPRHFAVFNIGEESGASVGNGWIALMPAPDRVYPCRIYYLPAWTDITNAAHVFNGHDGWDDWVSYDSVMKIATKDNDMQVCAQLASQMKAEAEARVLASCKALQRVAPSVGRDTAREHRASRYRTGL